MNTHAQPLVTTASAPCPLPSAFNDAIGALRALALRIDGWLAARKRIAADRDALARMSDRELGDIGLHRASVNTVAGGGRMRDDPF